MNAEHIFFNITILGDADGPAQWTIWTNEEKTKVGITCLDNTRIWKMIEAFELTIDVSIVDAQFILKWNYCIIIEMILNFSNKKEFLKHMV